MKYKACSTFIVNKICFSLQQDSFKLGKPVDFKRSVAGPEVEIR